MMLLRYSVEPALPGRSLLLKFKKMAPTVSMDLQRPPKQANIASGYLLRIVVWI